MDQPMNGESITSSDPEPTEPVRRPTLTVEFMDNGEPIIRLNGLTQTQVGVAAAWLTSMAELARAQQLTRSGGEQRIVSAASVPRFKR